jgi:hypothetical protein
MTIKTNTPEPQTPHEEPEEAHEPQAREHVLAGVGARQNDEASDPTPGSENFDDVSISDVMVGDPGFEPGTSSLSEKRSNRLS